MLRLTIASSQRRKLGADATRLFSETGGTVGRSARCDWMLPDERHLLSNQHARIVHDGRGYTIIDTSTNGVFLNGRDIPLGRNQSAVIRDGDRLYLADYVIDVAVIDRDRLSEAGHRGGATSTPAAFPGGEAGAFWEALGLPPSSLPDDARERLMRGLGTAMREAMALLSAAPPPVPAAAGDRLPQDFVLLPELTPDIAKAIDLSIRTQVVRDHAPEPVGESNP